MTNDNNNKPVLIFIFTFFILILLSFIPAGTKILFYETKSFDLFMDIKPDSLLFGQSKKINEEIIININLDNIAQANILSALNNYSFEKKSELIVQKKPGVDVSLSGNLSQFKFFSNAIKNASNSKVRILHFGDSGIEGDLMTAAIRETFQQKYGGLGAGFHQITPQDISHRMTTVQSVSNDWETGSLTQGNPKRFVMSLFGATSKPNSDNSWVKFESRYSQNRLFKNTRSFTMVRIVYTNAKASKLKYSFDNEADKLIDLKTGSDINEIILDAKKEVKSFKLTATMKDQVEILGVSLEGENGVYVDNIALRGNTGASIREIPLNVLEGFNKLIKPKLIVLSFGLNMATTGVKDFKWYEREMQKVIEHLKQGFPECSIILMTVGDRSIKMGQKFVTDPSLIKLVESQKTIAENTGIILWNMFEAMGGKDSMADWVRSNPPLASVDHIHLNRDGGGRVAELFCNALFNELSK